VTPQEKKNILVDYLKMKTEDQDWHAVSDAANDIREVEIKIRTQPMAQPSIVQPEPTSRKLEAFQKHSHPAEPALQAGGASAIGVTEVKEVEIPHHVDEVRKLLRLSDEDLVNRLFPDYSTPQRVSNA